MLHRTSLSVLTAALICAALLTGCLTPSITPPPSPAILQARAAVDAKLAACDLGGLASVSPVNVGFGFDDATITEVGGQHLAVAARWLTCNPGVETVVSPDADNHGDDGHMASLAQQRAQAVTERLRALGAKAAVIRILPRGGADPLTVPHMVINAEGRGW